MNYPKVGIRSTIDGRIQVRGKLEEQPINLAKSVAKLISETLRYPDGSPVECVLSDGNIGGVAEAAACAEKFERAGVGVSITVTPTWCYGTETIDLDPITPKAIFGFNGTERPGAVYLAAALAGHNQKGIPAFSIYGRDVRDSSDQTIPTDVAEKLIRFAKAGLAAAMMRGKSYLSLGGVSMGIAGSIVNDAFFQDYLGMRCEYVDMSEMSRRLELGIYDQSEVDKAIKWVKANCKSSKDANSSEYIKVWETVVKMTMIARDLMIGNKKLAELGFIEESKGHNAIAAGFQGQRHWTDYMPNGDFMEAMLCSSFDWNGTREPFILATENDSLNAVAMLFGKYLTNTAQVFCDVRTYWSPEAVKRVTGKDLPKNAENGFIHLINSGAAALDGTGQQELDGKPAMKPFWDIKDQEVQKCLDAVEWSPAVAEYFRGGGYSSSFKTKGVMPMTMSRVNLIKGLGPVLQIAEGYAVDLPDDISKIIEDRTDKTWPTTWFAPITTGKGAFSDVYSVMANWGANHCALCYGHVGADMIALASMLRIPVSMHNVPDQDVFRPSAWSAFGTSDLEGADYRACENFGPIYGKK